MAGSRFQRLLGIAVSTAAAIAVIAAPPAHAQPSGFPDLDGFIEAPSPADFSRPDRWANGYAFFRTPGGISCMVGSLKRCQGALPGLPAGPAGTCAVVVQTYEQSMRSEPFRFDRTDEPCSPSTDRLLDVGQKVTLTGNDTITCAAGADGLVACISGDNRHGFVLQPSGSWTF